MEFRQRSANKHEFYKNTAGLRSGNSSDSDSACLKVVSYVKVFELRGTVNESERYWATTNGLLVKCKVWLRHVVKCRKYSPTKFENFV